VPNEDDRRITRTAERQTEWEKAAAMDVRRRGLGILPDLLLPDTPARQLPVREQFPHFIGHADDGPERRVHRGLETSTKFSNLDFSATVRLRKIYRPGGRTYAGVFMGSYWYLGVSLSGDVYMKDGKNSWRLPGVACVLPGIDGNRIRIVRQGSRAECFVNDAYVGSLCGGEEPGKIVWYAYYLGAGFEDIEIRVPVGPHAAADGVREAPVEPERPGVPPEEDGPF
jgi:hypothetical protein